MMAKPAAGLISQRMLQKGFFKSPKGELMPHLIGSDTARVLAIEQSKLSRFWNMLSVTADASYGEHRVGYEGTALVP